MKKVTLGRCSAADVENALVGISFAPPLAATLLVPLCEKKLLKTTKRLALGLKNNLLKLT